jgi:hypothetical protein
MVHSNSYTRRQALKLVAGAALAAIPTVDVARQVAAGRNWCRLDPSFLVDGLIGNVYVAGELDTKYDTTGPIQLVFRIPEGSYVELLASDPGFGHGYDISYDYSPDCKRDHKKIDVEIEVFVPAITDKLPIRVEFVPNATVEVEDHKDGSTNKWIKVKTQLKKPKETKEQKEAREAEEKAAKEAQEAAEKAAKDAEKAAEEAAKDAEKAAEEAEQA